MDGSFCFLVLLVRNLLYKTYCSTIKGELIHGHPDLSGHHASHGLFFSSVHSGPVYVFFKSLEDKVHIIPHLKGVTI